MFEYDRSVASRPPATTQVVGYGNNLTGSTEVTIPTASAGSVEITASAFSDHVKVSSPDLGARMFVRLRVSQ